MSDRHTALTLITALTRALSHKIRTPLTVISNELSYVQSKGNDVERAQTRVKDISAILKLSCSLGSTPYAETEVDASAIASEIFKILDPLPKYLVRTDLTKFRATLQLIHHLLTDLSSDNAILVSHEEPSNAWQLTCKVKTGEQMDPPLKASAFAELFIDRLHLDLIEPPLIDAALEALQWKVALSWSKDLFSLTLAPA